MVMRTLLLLILSSWIFISCNKEDSIDYSPQLKLNFSTDSILFDTVFTNAGTTSRVLKVFNYNKKAVVITDIKLTGGDASDFKININGITASSVKDFKIKGNDSAYVFIKAFITPNNAETPFIIEDSLEFTLNGNLQKIPLIAYGQNAVYLNATELNASATFTKNKPYVIYNHLKINKEAVLTIEEGAKLYFHKGAKMLIAGSIKANGSYQDSIVFASDRLERIYDDEPGQWTGLHFLNTSKSNVLNYCIIKNALIGLRVDSLSNNSEPKLLLSNSIVKNHEVSAVIGYNASVTGINNLLYNCGQYLILALNGGDYHFYQNTFAGFNFNFPRNNPSLSFLDHLNDGTTLTKELTSTFINNIIWGSLKKELSFNRIGQKTFTTDFKNNLIKTDDTSLGSTNIYNEDPLFLNSRTGNFRLMDGSSAINKGADLSANPYFNILKKDLDDHVRLFPSELGSYEKL